MPTQDTSQLKEKILFLIRQRGPSLPVHLTRETGLSILFTSAFLSELLSERKLKISNMRVGSSPIYYISGQENQLEKFAIHLNSKEKEAFSLLQNKKVLKDKQQDPAIRVALRAIKDFAIPFRENEEIFWRYYLASEEQIKLPKPGPKIIQPEIQTTEKKLDIFTKEEPKKDSENPKKIAPKVSPKKSIKKTKENSKFFTKVKEFLSNQGIEILDIEEIEINKIIFRVKEQEEYLIIAYNKKRITEEDIIKAYKKAETLKIPYKILCFGSTLKKLENIIEAAKTLKSIEKIE